MTTEAQAKARALLSFADTLRTLRQAIGKADHDIRDSAGRILCANPEAVLPQEVRDSLRSLSDDAVEFLGIVRQLSEYGFLEEFERRARILASTCAPSIVAGAQSSTSEQASAN